MSQTASQPFIGRGVALVGNSKTELACCFYFFVGKVVLAVEVFNNCACLSTQSNVENVTDEINPDKTNRNYVSPHRSAPKSESRCRASSSDTDQKNDGPKAHPYESDMTTRIEA